MKTYKEFLTEAKKKSVAPTPVDEVNVSKLTSALKSEMGTNFDKENFGDDLIDYLSDAGRSVKAPNFVKAFRDSYKIKSHAIKTTEFVKAVEAFVKTYKESSV